MIRFLLIISLFSFAACSEAASQNEPADTCVLCSDAISERTVDVGFASNDVPRAFDGNAKDAFLEPGISDALSFAGDSTEVLAETGSSQGEDAPVSNPDEDSKGGVEPIIIGEGYYGEVPPYSDPIDSFAAVYDEAGEPVGVEDLTGSWTVLWFFPKASTFG